MSLIGGVKVSGVASGSTVGDRIINFVGYGVSGQIRSGVNVLAVCCFDYDYSIGQWVPMTHT